MDFHPDTSCACAGTALGRDGRLREFFVGKTPDGFNSRLRIGENMRRFFPIHRRTLRPPTGLCGVVNDAREPVAVCGRAALKPRLISLSRLRAVKSWRCGPYGGPRG